MFFSIKLQFMNTAPWKNALYLAQHQNSLKCKLYNFDIIFLQKELSVQNNEMFWCTELVSAKNFGFTLIQKQFVTLSKTALLNIHPVEGTFLPSIQLI